MVYLGTPRWLSSKEFMCKAGDGGDLGLVPGSERYSGGGIATHSSVLARKIPCTVLDITEATEHTPMVHLKQIFL